MKHLAIAATLILAGLVAYGVAAHSQLTGSANADPVKVDPKHYSVVLENDRVRILRISYGPSHPASVAIYLTDGTEISTRQLVRAAL